ncbi:hypothetical protein VTO42DRAFT_7484 [Malbranchea cinnamomea]
MNPEHGGGNGGGGGDGDGGRGGMSEWSSTIGIVTAIIGNILISFALNTQRYAHIRINREREHERLKLRVQQHGASRHARPTSPGDYGTLATSSVESPDSLRTVTGSRGRPFPESQSPEGSDLDDPDQSPRSFLSDRTVSSVEKRGRNRDRKSYLHSPYWWAGLILMTIGEAGNFLAYGFAPASIVSPLGVVALISNCVIAPFMLKEKFRQRDFWGVIVAIAGAVTVVLSAKTREVKIGPGDIWGMITTWEFELYLGLTIGLILVLMWASRKYGRKTIFIDLGLVGLFGGYTALSTKGVSSLLSYTLWHVITFPITYVLIAILALSAMMQIRYINRALQRFDSTQVIPTQFVLFTLSVIIGSAVLYRDFESATLHQALKFVGGCALTFLGVYLITSGRKSNEDVGSVTEDEEQMVGLLSGERYADDVSYEDADEPSGHAVPGHSVETAAEQQPTSHPQTDEEDLDYDGRIHTPHAHLSSSLSSMSSISNTSSLLKSQPHSPQSFPPNPWSSSYQENEGHAAVEPANTAPLPGTPPLEAEIPPTKVLLRFPSAPGLTESQPPRTPRASSESSSRFSSPKTDTLRSRLRGSFGSKTPLAIRFSPGPLLPPLSGGLSAVVAESLRRGEGSPEKRRTRSTSRKNKGSRRRTEPLLPGRPEGGAAYEADDGLTHADEADPNGQHRQEQSKGRLNRFSFLRRIPGLHSALRSNSQEIIQAVPSSSGDQGSYDTQRGRSLSDSWSESLGRLGDNVRSWRKQTDESISH